MTKDLHSKFEVVSVSADNSTSFQRDRIHNIKLPEKSTFLGELFFKKRYMFDDVYQTVDAFIIANINRNLK